MSSANFGQNAWLVDQMYQQYSKDPQSVDPEWRDFFKKNPQGNAEVSSAETPKESAGSRVSSEDAVQQQTVAQAASEVIPDSKKQQPEHTKRSVIPERKAPPAPKDVVDAPEAGKSVIRGAAKAVVKNMDLSLEIPTATSVRDMPAKLMFENRTMINNTLRARGGGKISFTHIIGYALIRAVMAHPDMNNSYEVVDGKPTLVTPEHINLGLAIDMVGKNGTRSLVVAAIKESETLSFSQFVEKYEDIVDRARHG